MLEDEIVKKVKKKINGKQKGNRGERAIGKMLVDRYNEYFKESLVYDVDVKKMPASGGWHLDGFRGDLLIRNKTMFDRFPFTIEVKNGYDFIVDDIFAKSFSSIIFRSIDQNEGSVEPNTVPIQIIKRDRGCIFCVYRDIDIQPTEFVKFDYKGLTYYMVLFEEFLQLWFKRIEGV